MPYFFHGNPITTFILTIVGEKYIYISTFILAFEGRKGQWKKKLTVISVFAPKKKKKKSITKSTIGLTALNSTQLERTELHKLSLLLIIYRTTKCTFG